MYSNEENVSSASDILLNTPMFYVRSASHIQSKLVLLTPPPSFHHNLWLKASNIPSKQAVFLSMRN